NKLFFSSRRRHTRSYGDWSSDVCSSDLAFQNQLQQTSNGLTNIDPMNSPVTSLRVDAYLEIKGSNDFEVALKTLKMNPQIISSRSEERRVGKECRSEVATDE